MPAAANPFTIAKCNKSQKTLLNTAFPHSHHTPGQVSRRAFLKSAGVTAALASMAGVAVSRLGGVQARPATPA
ncbi:MAG: twin-arginine translocation signal domain-containing protein [Verrucomicrobia bacterium]|nr:twin-arginine translocation signal domain-containing protein [Verrucomicrobiota bacterium]